MSSPLLHPEMSAVRHLSTGGDDLSATVRVSEHNGNPVVQAGALNAADRLLLR